MSTTYSQRHHERRNINERERIASVVAGGALIGWGVAKGSWPGLLAAVAGGALTYRGVKGYCHVYDAIGMHTDHRTGRNVSVPYELGIRVDKEIVVQRPREQVYHYWRQLENLPKFMRHLESVTEIDNKHSHWVAKSPTGRHVWWKAEIVNEKENELIGWRTLPGADVPNAGSVQFKDVPGGTLVKIELQYDPPGGSVGALVARLLGRDPDKQIEEDLHRLKTLLETGEVSTSKGHSAGHRELAAQAARKPATKKGWERDVVTTASEESFPASDPPSWTPETL